MIKMKLPATFETLILEAKHFKLYKKLVQQLNKDFLYANVDLDFHEAILPSSLNVLLQETIYKIIQEKFTDYLNLLYIVDVPEYAVRTLNVDDTVMLDKQVSFLILKREWQKVWFRYAYS